MITLVCIRNIFWMSNVYQEIFDHYFMLISKIPFIVFGQVSFFSCASTLHNKLYTMFIKKYLIVILCWFQKYHSLCLVRSLFLVVSWTLHNKLYTMFIKKYLIVILCWFQKYHPLCLVRSLFLVVSWTLHNKLYTIIRLIQKPVDFTCHSSTWVLDV